MALLLDAFLFVKIDIWGLGITLLEITNKAPPNLDNPAKAMLAVVSGERWKFDDPSKWSSDLSSFIGYCLQTDPELRPTAAQLLDV